MTVAAYSSILYDSHWIFLFLGCVCSIIHMRRNGSFFELFLSIHRLFWTPWCVPGHLATFKRTWWLHAANVHTAAGTVSFGSISVSLFMQVVLWFLKRQEIRTFTANLFLSIHPKAVFNFYSPVHDHKHVFIGRVRWYFSRIFRFVTTFLRLQCQSCFTIRQYWTVFCHMCGRVLSY